MSLHIAVSIPTFNRVNELKKNIDHLLRQTLPDECQLSILVANTAGSTDGTAEYLEDLAATHPNVVCYNKQAETVLENLKHLTMIMPEDVDWVWLMGDDDFLPNENALGTVVGAIEQSKGKDLHFVHACQARRSKNSGEASLNTVAQLCQQFGYHEMLGWMSSIIVTRDIFCRAMLNTQQKFTHKGEFDELGVNYSAYTHSRFLYAELHDKFGMFIDLPLVEPQDENQTEESIKRWETQNMGERYFFVVDDLIALKELGCLPEGGCSDIFFRYITYNFWDRYFTHLLGKLVNPNLSFEEKKQPAFVKLLQSHWNRLNMLADMLGNKTFAKQIKIRVRNGIQLTELYFRTDGKNEFVQSLIVQQLELTQQENYPFSVKLN